MILKNPKVMLNILNIRKSLPRCMKRFSKCKGKELKAVEKAGKKTCLFRTLYSGNDLQRRIGRDSPEKLQLGNLSVL